MEFTPEDFNRMMFNVYDNRTQILQRFPDLRLYKEFEKRLPDPLDKDKVLCYIFFTYDKNSPYRIKYKDLTQRKVRAIMDAGYTLGKDKKFHPEVEDILQGRSPNVNQMIIAFLKMHNSLQYSHLITLEAMYYQKVTYIFQGTAEKIKELQEVKKAYEEAEQDFLMQDSNKGLIKSLYLTINADKLALSPEDIAKDIKDKGIKQLAERLSDDNEEE